MAIRWFCVCVLVVICCDVTGLQAQEFANDIIQRKQESKSQVDDESPGALTGTSPTTRKVNQAKAEANREQAIELATNEMNQLIPGQYAKDSANYKLLVKIATSYLSGNGQGVTQALNELKAVEPNLPPQGLLFAGVNYSLNRPREGRQILEQTALQNPDHPAVPIAFCRLALSQGRLLDAQALVEMSAKFVKSYNLAPDVKKYYEIQLLESQVAVAMRQRRFDDALNYAAQWEGIDPGNSKMMINRAEIEFQKGNIAESEKYIGKFRAVTPDSRPTELVLATWFQRKGDVAGTEEWVKKAAAKYPDNSLVMLEYGNWAVSREDFETASLAVRKIEEKEGETPATKLINGRIAFANGAYGVAEAHFDSLYQRQPNNFDVSNMYALCLIESRDSAKNMRARQIAQRNLKTLPNNLVAQAAFGWILLKMGNLGDAKQVLSRVAQLKRRPPEIGFFLATLLHQDGKTEQAKQFLEASLAQKGMFLYRIKAKELLNEINGTSGLPNPNGN